MIKKIAEFFKKKSRAVIKSKDEVSLDELSKNLNDTDKQILECVHKLTWRDNLKPKLVNAFFIHCLNKAKLDKETKDAATTAIKALGDEDILSKSRRMANEYEYSLKELENERRSRVDFFIFGCLDIIKENFGKIEAELKRNMRKQDAYLIAVPKKLEDCENAAEAKIALAYRLSLILEGLNQFSNEFDKDTIKKSILAIGEKKRGNPKKKIKTISEVCTDTGRDIKSKETFWKVCEVLDIPYLKALLMEEYPIGTFFKVYPEIMDALYDYKALHKDTVIEKQIKEILEITMKTRINAEKVAAEVLKPESFGEFLAREFSGVDDRNR